MLEQIAENFSCMNRRKKLAIVMRHLLRGLATATGGCLLAYYTATAMIPAWVMLVVSLVTLLMLFGAVVQDKRKGYNDDTNPFLTWSLYAFLLFTFCMGYCLGPMLQAYAMVYGASSILLALALTAGVVGVVSLIVLALTPGAQMKAVSKLTHASEVLLWSTLSLILFGVLISASGAGSLVVLHGLLGAGIFSLWLGLDLVRVCYAEDDNMPAILCASNLFLDIINIFVSILAMREGPIDSSNSQGSSVFFGLLMTIGALCSLAVGCKWAAQKAREPSVVKPSPSSAFSPTGTGVRCCDGIPEGQPVAKMGWG